MASNLPNPDKVVCEICSEIEVNWKCENCNKLACNQCITGHMMKPAPLGHMIISFQTDEQPDVTSEVDKHCKIHTKEVYQRYCEICDCLVCFECALTSHNLHKLCSIPEMVHKKRAEYEGILRDIKSNSLPALTKIIQSFKQGKEEYIKEVESILADINSQAEKLKREIDDVKELFIIELKEKQSKDLETLTMNQQKYEKELTHIKCTMELCKSKLQTTQEMELLSVMERMKDKLKQCQKAIVAPPVVQPPPFISASVDQKELKEIFGSIDLENEDENTSDDADNIDKLATTSRVKVISKFEEKGPVTCIATQNQEAWILQSGNLSLTKKDGSKVKSFQVDFYIHDMAISALDELLVSDRNSKKIKILQESGKFVDWVDTYPCEPYGISVCKNGEVFVSLGYDKSCLSVYGKYQGCLSEYDKYRGYTDRVFMILTPQGQIKAQYSKFNYTSLNKYFRSAYHIAQNEYGDLAACSKYEGKYVVAVGNTEDDFKDLKYLYTDSEIQVDNPLLPQAITYIDHCLLVTDYFNSAVHSVDKDGKVAKFLMSTKNGLCKPVAIAVDSSGYVWVGCATGSVFVVKIQM